MTTLGRVFTPWIVALLAGALSFSGVRAALRPNGIQDAVRLTLEEVQSKHPGGRCAGECLLSTEFSLLVFFASTDCAPSLHSLTFIEALAREYDNVAVVGIASGFEDAADVARFRRAAGISFPVFFGEGVHRGFGAIHRTNKPTLLLLRGKDEVVLQ